jgi:hypothetical protein
MSIEAFVFFSGPLPSAQAVNEAMRQLKLDFAIQDTNYDFGTSGFVPMTYRVGDDETPTGTEVLQGLAKELVDILATKGIDLNFDHYISFRWGSDFLEGACSLALAAAVATLTGGMIWEDAGGDVLSIEDVVSGCLAMAPLGMQQ